MRAKTVNEAFEQRDKSAARRKILFPQEEKLRELYNNNYKSVYGFDSTSAMWAASGSKDTFKEIEQMYIDLLNKKSNVKLYVNFQNPGSSTGLVDDDFSLKPIFLKDLDTIVIWVKEVIQHNAQTGSTSNVSIADILSPNGDRLGIDLDLPKSIDIIVAEDRVGDEENYYNEILKKQTESNKINLKDYKETYTIHQPNEPPAEYEGMLSIPLAFYLKTYYNMRVGDAIIKFIDDYNFRDEEYEKFLQTI